MSEPAPDPRAQYRQLPEPVRPEEFVETSDTTAPVVTEPQVESAQRLALLAGGTP